MDQVSRTTQDIVNTFSLDVANEKPFILIVSGFQGSGKSTILRLLQQKIGFYIVSTDEIRYELINKGYLTNEKLQEDTVSIVYKVAKVLIEHSQSFAIDANVKPAQLQKINSLLQEPKAPHKVFSFWLEVDPNILKERIRSRHISDKYQGTLEELEYTLKLNDNLDRSFYDKIVSATELTPEQTAELIYQFIINHEKDI